MLNEENLSDPIKAIILDDEIDACKNLEVLIREKWSDKIEIIAIANSTEEAEGYIKNTMPDVLFMDIEMPNENAFQFLERLGNIPFEIIFVTAYDEYALRALKLNAIDYLLKPICNEELDVAIVKLEEKLLTNRTINELSNNEKIVQLLGQIKKKSIPESLVLRMKKHVMVLQFEEVQYLKAEGNYTRICFEKDGKQYEELMGHLLSHYEEILTPEMFFRTHKSYLVNKNKIKKVNKIEQCTLELKNGTLLPISRRRYNDLLEFIQH